VTPVCLRAENPAAGAFSAERASVAPVGPTHWGSHAYRDAQQQTVRAERRAADYSRSIAIRAARFVIVPNKIRWGFCFSMIHVVQSLDIGTCTGCSLSSIC
jgi:hypothetical protein